VPSDHTTLNSSVHETNCPKERFDKTNKKRQEIKNDTGVLVECQE